MSLDIRYLTNGTKNVYVVVDSASRPVSVNYYDTRDEIPVQIMRRKEIRCSSGLTERGSFSQ